MIEFENITKIFAGKDGPLKAIDGVSFRIERNEIFGIIGESGAGKSTLLRFINALERPSEGKVLVDGVDVQSLDKKELRLFKKDISMIFQHYNLLGNKTVAENITLPLELHNYESSMDVDQVLEFVGLEDKKDSYPRELSGGQKQRIGIARGLLTRPKILLCDEPTSALDENTTREIVALLDRAAKEFDVTVLIVTHELDVVKRLCDRAAILDKGKLVDLIQVDKKAPTDEDFNVSYHELAREVLTNV